jgi:hypothetical protein
MIHMCILSYHAPTTYALLVRPCIFTPNIYKPQSIHVTCAFLHQTPTGRLLLTIMYFHASVHQCPLLLYCDPSFCTLVGPFCISTQLYIYVYHSFSDHLHLAGQTMMHFHTPVHTYAFLNHAPTACTLLVGLCIPTPEYIYVHSFAILSLVKHCSLGSNLSSHSSGS